MGPMNDSTIVQVVSVLPPSTMTRSSNPSAAVRESVCLIQRASFRTGMMTAMVIERGGRVWAEAPQGTIQVIGLVSLNMKYMTTATVDQKTTCLCQNSTSP